MSGDSSAAPVIHKADPALRRGMYLAVLAIGAVLAGLGVWFHRYLDQLPMDSVAQMRDSTARTFAAFTYVIDGATLLLFLYGLYLLERRRRIRQGERYPLPGVRLFHDTPVLQGAGKQCYERRLRRLALLCLAAAALALAGGQWWLHHLLAAHPLLKP